MLQTKSLRKQLVVKLIHVGLDIPDTLIWFVEGTTRDQVDVFIVQESTKPNSNVKKVSFFPEVDESIGDLYYVPSDGTLVANERLFSNKQDLLGSLNAVVEYIHGHGEWRVAKESFASGTTAFDEENILSLPVNRDGKIITGFEYQMEKGISSKKFRK